MADSTDLRWQYCSALIIRAKLECPNLFSAQRILGSSCWSQRPNETSPDTESRNFPSIWVSDSEEKKIYLFHGGLRPCNQRTSPAGYKNTTKAILELPNRISVLWHCISMQCHYHIPALYNMWSCSLTPRRFSTESPNLLRSSQKHFDIYFSIYIFSYSFIKM